MTETYFFNIADETKPTKVTTVETDSGPTEWVSSGKKVYVMRLCSSRIIILSVLTKKTFLVRQISTLLNIQSFLL